MQHPAVRDRPLQDGTREDGRVMLRTPSAKVASVGVTRTALAIQDELGWLFREQPIEDYGIDAHAEVVDGERVRGRLLALQIKSGTSWFERPGPGGWWFRPDQAHVQYWMNHSLPVVVVLYHPETKHCYWQLVNRRTLVETSTGGWKLLVPESQVLDAHARAVLREAAEGDPYVLRIRELQLAKPWIELLASGTRLVIDIEEWVNKTSGRGSISLGIDHEDGKDPEPVASWGVFLGLASYADVVPRLFGWADVALHAETYEEADARGDDEMFDWADYVPPQEEEEEEEEREPHSLRPYANGAGEVDFWRLELTLNEVGRAFLVVDRFATDSGRQLTVVREP